MTPKTKEMGLFNWRFRVSLVLMFVGSLCFGAQFLYQHYIGSTVGTVGWLAAFFFAALFCYLPYRSGLIMRSACKPDYLWYLGIFLFATLALTLSLAQKGLDVNVFKEGVNSSVTSYGDGLTSSLQSISTQEKSEESGWVITPQAWIKVVFSELRQRFLSLVNLLFRIMLVFWLVSVLLAGGIVFVLARMLRIRSGALIIFSVVTTCLGVWALQVLEPYTGYVLPGFFAYALSLGLAINWSALQMNRKVWAYHPVYYDLMCELSSEKLKEISRSSVRESILRHVGDGATSTDASLVDAIENRLVEERLLIRLESGQYRPAYCKRLGLTHLLASAVALIYLMNGGFGVIELIPDALPLIGNLDEAGIAIGVFGWIYKLYLLDKAEEEGVPISDQSPH